jgi:hypothetical protein
MTEQCSCETSIHIEFCYSRAERYSVKLRNEEEFEQRSMAGPCKHSFKGGVNKKNAGFPPINLNDYRLEPNYCPELFILG